MAPAIFVSASGNETHIHPPYLIIMQHSIPVQQAPDTALYPSRSRFVQLAAGNMHYVDEGAGEVILFVHGTPAWSFLYRRHIAALSKKYRCIAIDHLGFGLSEKPTDFPGTPQAHAHNLSEFIQKLALKNMIWEVNDFGAPIGLVCAIEHARRSKRMVLFNTWLWETQSNPAAQKVDKIIRSALGRFLYLNLNFSPRVLLKQGFSDKKKLSKKLHRQYLLPFPRKSTRHSLLRLAQSLTGSSNWYQEQREKLGALDKKPWLILWGMKDKFLTPDYLEKWTSRLPGAAVHTWDCGHFVQEECPAESIGAIEAFMR